MPLAATDFYQVLDTSDVPGGVVNIVTGLHDELIPTLASHDDVDGVWYFGSEPGSRDVETASIGNMKRTWVNYGARTAWGDRRIGQGEHFLREATQIKNIWIPYGE
jgi:aldehyde dehydrogenase (NAD+)